MSNLRRLQFSTEISAPADRVFDLMLAPDTYKDWTSAFMPGSYYEGTWGQGEKIRFLSPAGGGVLTEVADYRPNEFLSIRHLGMIKENGEVDTTSPEVREFLPAYENYTFVAVPGGTKLIIDQDVTPQYETQMTESWKKGLQRLKELCESA
ncbi:MAG: SRPBCC domain-containing protein [Cellvibrionaceae bacterium]|nr:SRPBCC domain-containing protein [Cellvibrionaceae bacterium]